MLELKKREGESRYKVVVVSSQIVRIVRAFRVVLKETSCCHRKTRLREKPEVLDLGIEYSLNWD